MKYIQKIPSTDKELSSYLIAGGWEKIKEPSNLLVAILSSVPFMLLNGVICYFIIVQYSDIFARYFNDFIDKGTFSINIGFEYILFTFIFVYLLILLHELIHAVFIPNFIKSENTYYGIRLWGGFVFTTDKISKSRFLLISISPFIILSVILPIILGLLNVLNGVIICLVLLNALASSVDVLTAFLVLIQAPNGSTIVNNGFETYYKK